MARNRLPPDKASPQTNNALDRWDNEGGSAAKLGSDALAANLETLSQSERQILQCLGAAVVIGWNDLPTDVQRTLFMLASAEGATSEVSELRARIARFLHDHKDDRTRGYETGEEL